MTFLLVHIIHFIYEEDRIEKTFEKQLNLLSLPPRIFVSVNALLFNTFGVQNID